MNAVEPYVWDDIASSFVRKAARWAHRRYGRYGPTYGDFAQEVNLWLYGEGRRKVEKWLANSPQQTTRIYMALLDIARSYGEREKASVSGYETDDVFWYTANLIDELKPYARNENWAGENEHTEDGGRGNKPLNEGGDFIAMVMDIRRAAKTVGWDTQAILAYLGHERPRIGRRKVISNSTAQSITAGQE